MEQKLIAFWKYDREPFVLSGEVESFTSDGYVMVKGYGYAFNPIKILPYDEGIKVKDKIEELGRSTRVKIAETYAECKNSVNELLKLY